MRRRKERPDRTTLHAWYSRPINDSSSRLGQARLSPHSSSNACKRCSLSVGRRSWEASVSISMPRNVMQGVGPSRLCSAIGILSAAHDLSRVSIADAQIGESGGPITIKSSR